jgi:hypothetical protein
MNNRNRSEFVANEALAVRPVVYLYKRPRPLTLAQRIARALRFW